MTTTPTAPQPLSLVDILRSRRQTKTEPALPDRAQRRAIRAAAGASLNDVALRCGVSNFAIRSWERPDGHTEPRGENRAAYKEALEEMEAFASELTLGGGHVVAGQHADSLR